MASDLLFYSTWARKDAEAHATEDRTRRQEVDQRNQVDTLAYRVERLLDEMGDHVPMHEKARAEQLVLRTANGSSDDSAEFVVLAALKPPRTSAGVY